MMEAIRESVDQVAAEAKLGRATARKVIYLLTLAQDGRTLESAAEALRMKPETVKGWARKYDITLADFDPFPKKDFPIRPKPRKVLKLTGARSGAPLFGGREARAPGRCSHDVTGVVEGKAFCCDCGKPIKPKRKEGGSDD
jgi:hypothetical protein